MISPPRRVVTGIDADGKSCVVHDAPIPHTSVGPVAVTNIWTGTSLPADNAAPLEQGLAPFRLEQLFSGEYGFMFVEQAPGTGQDDPGMHATPTADHFMVLDGEIVLVLDSGDVPLGKGDVAVLRGVWHGWRNDSERPAYLVTFVLPAVAENCAAPAASPGPVAGHGS
jgi:mannose-6-phosphate isomerase-like protein (cupin superfamily)